MRIKLLRDALAGERGVHTKRQAFGAWPNGSRVRKTAMGPQDVHAVGALATVMGSLGPHAGEYGYFVRWDDGPQVVFIRGSRLELVAAEA